MASSGATFTSLPEDGGYFTCSRCGTVRLVRAPDECTGFLVPLKTHLPLARYAGRWLGRCRPPPALHPWLGKHGLK